MAEKTAKSKIGFGPTSRFTKALVAASYLGMPKERLFDAEFEAVIAYKRSVA
jgi:hypothetical protein